MAWVVCRATLQGFLIGSANGGGSAIGVGSATGVAILLGLDLVLICFWA